MDKIINNRNGIYLIFEFICIIFFYISVNVLYAQTSSVYDEALINSLPNAESFVSKMNIKAADTNNNIVIIEWEGINYTNLVYYVYRSERPITGRASLIDAKVIDYVKATNDSKLYNVLDRPVFSSKYYYAVVSYINDLSFYNALENTDTLSVNFNGIKNTNLSASIMENTNNIIYSNELYNTNIYSNSAADKENIVNNLKYLTNFITNTYFITNTHNITNSYSVTNMYSLTNIHNAAAPANKKNGYAVYKNEYRKALAEFKRGNYSAASSILEPLSLINIDRALYYDINLLLGKCCKYLGRKKKALDVFNRIKTYNSKEVSFWINQVLTDL